MHLPPACTNRQYRKRSTSDKTFILYKIDPTWLDLSSVALRKCCLDHALR